MRGGGTGSIKRIQRAEFCNMQSTLSVLRIRIQSFLEMRVQIRIIIKILIRILAILSGLVFGSDF